MRRELLRLKGMRGELANAIEVARGHGDLSENADYDAAKEKSGLVEAKIRDLEAKLAAAEIIDPLKLGELVRVVFGASVKIMDIDSSEERVVTIVGADEGDIDRGLISLESPIGRSLIGKEIGDVVKVSVPGGSREYEVSEIFVKVELHQVEAEEAETAAR